VLVRFCFFLKKHQNVHTHLQYVEYFQKYCKGETAILLLPFSSHSLAASVAVLAE